MRLLEYFHDYPPLASPNPFRPKGTWTPPPHREIALDTQLLRELVSISRSIVGFGFVGFANSCRRSMMRFQTARISVNGNLKRLCHGSPVHFV